MDHATLLLADGTALVGAPFGAHPPTIAELTGDPNLVNRMRDIGEIVFNTAMSGYVEVLTDPSYSGQIVAMTYPHIGNYGVDRRWSEGGVGAVVPEPPESTPVAPAAFVVRELYDGPLPRGRIALHAFLAAQGVPGIRGIDTRALTLHLRTAGSQNAIVVRPARGSELSVAERDRALELLASFPPMEGRGLIAAVGTAVPVHLAGTGGPHLALYDCGVKANIVRELQALGCALTLFPSAATAAEIAAAAPDALLLSNGPGDPAVLNHQVEQTRALVGRIPLLGICLGHQIIAEAIGAQTFKMSFGHHGVNHPVRDERSRRVFVTSQNHGFAVDEATLPPGTEVWFRNANDGSVEGVRDDARMIRTTQFHPESAPGPHDSRWIFAAFLEGIGGQGHAGA